jgi:hypothetical protein
MALQLASPPLVLNQPFSLLAIFSMLDKQEAAIRPMFSRLAFTRAAGREK